MTRPLMSCDEFAEASAGYIERTADEATAARIEAHAMSCPDCGPLLALLMEASSLPELTPSRDLWPQIAARIETPVVDLPSRAGVAAIDTARVFGRQRPSPLWLGLAAAGLVAVTATVTREIVKRDDVATAPAPVQVAQAPQATLRDTGTTPAAAPVAATAAAPAAAATPDVTAPSVRARSATVAEKKSSKSVASGRSGSAPRTLAAAPRAPRAGARLVSNPATAAAELTYDREISRLRAVMSRRRGQLDSATVATIEKNLVVIDDAIRQCKLALRKDPASRFLLESLNDAMDTKVQLLRTAATLPSKM